MLFKDFMLSSIMSDETVYKRTLDLKTLLKNKSYFLFGPRNTGKSFLIKQTLDKDTKVINLLQSDVYLELLAEPHRIRERIDFKKDKLVVIDEIQKIPILLDEVHYMIEEYKIHFLLTGSSLKKLKSKNNNLLGGRARKAELFPLTFDEIQDFKIETYLRYGGLPFILRSQEKDEDLSSYVFNFLNEEIKLEARIRKIDFFHRFLQSAAAFSSEIINYSNIASDIGVSEITIKSYYELLEDSLVGFQLFPWRKGRTRKSIASSKFYFFDTGVLHSILKSPKILDTSSDVYGRTFEQFIAQEIRAYLSYRRLDYDFNFWRSLDKKEVDFVVNNEIAIEVKTAKKFKADQLSGLKQIGVEGNFKKRILVTFDPTSRTVDNIDCVSWKDFLIQLWDDKIIA